MWRCIFHFKRILYRVIILFIRHNVCIHERKNLDWHMIWANTESYIKLSNCSDSFKNVKFSKLHNIYILHLEKSVQLQYTVDKLQLLTQILTLQIPSSLRQKILSLSRNTTLHELTRNFSRDFRLKICSSIKSNKFSSLMCENINHENWISKCGINNKHNIVN